MKPSDLFEILTYSELEEAVENDTSDNNYRTAATFLLDAVEDWPTYNLKEPSDLITELHTEVRQDLTYDNLNRYYQKLSQTSWEATAVAELLELFDFERKDIFDQTITLEAIIDRLTKHYRFK